MTTNNAINSTFPSSPSTPSTGGTGVSSPTAHTLPIAEGSSNFNFLGPLTNGQLLIGSTGADPVAAAITAGSGITVTNGAGTVTIAATGNPPFVTVTGTSQSMSVNTIYAANNASLVTLTLPATANPGDEITVLGQGSGGWTISQNTGQIVHFGTVSTTSGTGGSLSSTSQYDAIKYTCLVANTTWTAYPPGGNITYV